MKVIFTFEFSDLLAQIEKTLAMNGVRALTDDEGRKLIHFNHRKKEVTIHGEVAPVPSTCLFCGGEVHPTPSTTTSVETNSSEHRERTGGVDEGDDDDEENVPMSLEELRAQSSRLERRRPTVQRGAEAHAKLASMEPTLLPGESTTPPTPGEDF